MPNNVILFPVSKRIDSSIGSDFPEYLDLYDYEKLISAEILKFRFSGQFDYEFDFHFLISNLKSKIIMVLTEMPNVKDKYEFAYFIGELYRISDYYSKKRFYSSYDEELISTKIFDFEIRSKQGCTIPRPLKNNIQKIID